MESLRKSQTEPLNRDKSDTESGSVSCGLGPCRPSWLQVFASKKSYVLVYGLLGMNQSAIGSYFIGTISTIEKRFKLPSSTSGLIASSWDAGALCTVLLITYLGGGGQNKARWVSVCALFAAFSCFLRYLPHLLFGPSLSSSIGNTGYQLCNDLPNENCDLNSEGLLTTVILVLAQIALGVGSSTYNTLGAAYLDDNALKDKAPFLISIATCFRHAGPTIGFLWAAYALKYHETLQSPPYSADDQRWIGAWHLGWTPLGLVHLATALLMGLFPRVLPREARRRESRQNTYHLPSLSNNELSTHDLKNKIQNLLKNPILMFNALSSTCYVFGIAGYAIFLPKYIEAQFMQSASRANFITGTIGLICTMIGIILSGALISKMKPHPRILSAWSIFTKIVDLSAYVSFAFISCKTGMFDDDIIGNDRLSLASSCNQGCGCYSGKYSPVCDQNLMETFFSPCHAGCKSTYTLNRSMVFTECSCSQVPLTEGACPANCETHVFLFLTLLCFLKFLSSTGRAGNTIMQYRSVDPVDKSLSIALTEVMLSGLAFIPAPIIYGFILDSSCLVWGEDCGKDGNCIFYDKKNLRFYLNFTSAGFILLAILFDFGVFTSVKTLKIYDGDVYQEVGVFNCIVNFICLRNPPNLMPQK